MNVTELKGYMVLCEQMGKKPTFEGLNKYYEVWKGLDEVYKKVDGLDASYSPRRNEVYVTYKDETLFILQGEHLEDAPKDIFTDDNKLLLYVLSSYSDVIDDIITCFKEED